MGEKKNILVLTGSPRTGGNSELLADAFIKGAGQSGHTVTKFRAGKKKILGCIACQKCFSNGAACVFNDDFNELAPLIESSDILVLATPLYWFTFPAQIKAAIDKFYALMVAGREVKVKESVLMVAAETDRMTDFDGIVRSYELINNYMGWQDKGMLLIPNVNKIGDILATDAFARGEQMGRDI